MGQIIQFLGGKTGGLDQISNKDATILYCLANSVQVDYAKIILEDLIHKLNKKTMENIVPYLRFISLLLEHMAPKYDNKELTINHTQETKSSLAMDTGPSHPSPPIPVVGEMHKEAQQAAGGRTSLGDTSKDGANPQLSSGSNLSVLVDKTKSAKDGFKTAHNTSSANMESRADDILRNVHLLQSQKKELEQAKVTSKAKVASMKAKPSYLDINQLTKLLEKLKTLDSLLGLLKMVTNTLNRFATLVENASRAITMGVPLAGKATASPAEGEKDADTNLKNKLVDLLGIDIFTQYYNKKLLYERYYKKMKKDKTLRSSTMMFSLKRAISH
nr:hypothetical protein [Tanacetum cinerariifolium]